MKPLLIKNGRVMDPASGHDAIADVLLADGNPKGNSHSPRHAARIGNRGEVDERDNVETICDSVCDFERQPGLADAAHADESHYAVRRQ